MARYELSDGKSHKFWSAELSGRELTTFWGRIGTGGQSKTKSFDSEEVAKKELEKVTRSKTKKGYALVAEDASAPANAPKPAKKNPPSTKKAPPPKTPTSKAQAPKTPTSKVQTPKTQPDAAPAESAELPDETLVRLDVLAPYLPPYRATVNPLTVLTIDKAWKRFFARGGKAENRRIRDKQFDGLGTILNAACAGDLPELPVDSDAAGRFVVCAANSMDWADKVEGLIDVLMAPGGLEYAVRANLASLDWYGGEHAKRGIARGEGSGLGHRPLACLSWLRMYVCSASEEEHEAALVSMRTWTPTNLSQKVALSALFPSEGAFREAAMEAFTESAKRTATADSAHGVTFAAKVLLWDATSIDEATALSGSVSLGRAPLDLAPALVCTGANLAPLLMKTAAAYDALEWKDKDTDVAIAALLCAAPSRETLQWLVGKLDNDRFRSAVGGAASAYPIRALSLLGPIAAGRTKARDAAAGLLGVIFRAHPGALEPASKTWSDGEREKIVAIAGDHTIDPPAALADCPKVFREARWAKKRPKAKKKEPLTLTPLDYAVHMKWPAGLRDKWLQQRGEYGWCDFDTDEKWRDTLKSRGVLAVLLCAVPEHIGREHLPRWKPGTSYYTDGWADRVVARFELAARDGIAYYLDADRVPAVTSALPYADPSFALLIADAYVRLKSARKAARAWLLLHPEAALIGLIPLVFGDIKPRAETTRRAIGFLVGAGHSDLLIEVAARYGDEAKARAEILAQLDPLDDLPKKIPTLPDWSSGVVPPVLKGGGSLPKEALQVFLTMLAISKPGEPYAGVEVACEHLDTKSLSRFSWSLFEAWRLGGMESKQSWAFLQMAFLGDDECARRLTPILKVWPGDGGHARATLGLDILAGIGTDMALMNLYGMSQKLKFKGLKNKAGEKVQEIATERGLTELELADRLVPDFDLDESGRTTLDFGPRAFVVAFDEALKPIIRDDQGKARKSLPKAGASDDAEKAAAAIARFKALKKDVKSVAQMQIARLEEVMCQGRTWTPADFQTFLVDHPLLINVVRRVVWGVFHDDRLTTSFRVGEDRSLSDAKDDALELPEGRIGIVHRLQLSEADLTAWGDVFADYELLQPFDQLSRSTYALTDAERKAKAITRVEGLTVPTGKVLGLEKYGWRRGQPEDAGIIGQIEREVPGVGCFVLALDPGMIVGNLGEWPEQKLGKVGLHQSSWSWNNELDLDKATPMVLSEVIRALETLNG